MLKKISIFITLLIVVSFTQINCGRQYVSDSALSTTPSTNDDFKLKCEAYLFDAQLKRDGKPTSFRLDLYQLDTLIGIGGRGYLGKGALKGYMSADSLKVYFPASNEYVLEAITDLMNSFECTEKHPEFRLFELFFDLPDSIDFPTSINITSDYEDTNKPEFIVSTTNCPWRISLPVFRKPWWKFSWKRPFRL